MAGQREDFAGCALGLGHARTGFAGAAGLQVVGDGVVDVGGDAGLLERLADFVACGGTYDVQMRHVVVAEFVRGFQGRACERGGIGARDLAAAGVPLVEVRKFDAQDGRLHFVHAAVAAVLGALIAAGPAVLAQRSHFARQRFVVGRDRAAIAERAQILGGVEAEAAERAPTARLATRERRAVRLRAIFNQRDAGARLVTASSAGTSAIRP